MDTNGHSVLLVCSSRSASEKITRRLRDIGFGCSYAHCVQQASEELANDQYSAVIVRQDVVRDALGEFCRTARSADPNLLIIPLLNRHDENLDLELLNCGADDVVTDQHCPAAVAKRVAIRLGSRRTLDFDCEAIRIGDTKVDFVNGRVHRDGEYTVCQSARPSC